MNTDLQTVVMAAIRWYRARSGVRAAQIATEKELAQAIESFLRVW